VLAIGSRDIELYLLNLDTNTNKQLEALVDLFLDKENPVTAG